MLSLHDPIWRTLEGGYRVPYDASVALAEMETGESVWDELWQELHHQGDIGLASYAAIPQLVRIAETHGLVNWNLFALAATIEIQRHRKTNPPVPDWLASSYHRAWEKLVNLALGILAEPVDDPTLRSALSVIALGRGNPQLGALLNYCEPSDVAEFVNKTFAWSRLYA